MTLTQLQAAVDRLPSDAKEAVVSQVFCTDLIRGLGFVQGESVPQYPTSIGSVDHALRKTNGDDIFLATGYNPFLLIELKERGRDLSEGSAPYFSAVKQLKGYLLDKRCQSAKWGIITNGQHIQLFRKHGKAIHPATPCIQLNLDNVDDVVTGIREKIEAPHQALTVAIYNNKGGVGKTTTTINLASILRLMDKKVLVIDFDPNQQDLTSALGLQVSSGSFYQALSDKRADIRSAITPYSLAVKGKTLRCFHVIPADEKLDTHETELKQQLKIKGLRQALLPLTYKYDYILIDSPPNWRFFSQSAVYAADVVLIPTKHNNLFSLENAAVAIKQFIPEVQTARQLASALNYGPVALPIFWNGEKITDPQRKAAHTAIDNIIRQAKQAERFDLKPYFYPKATRATANQDIFELPSYANISNAAFARIPAAYQDRTARSYYQNLAKEYFLQ